MTYLCLHIKKKQRHFSFRYYGSFASQESLHLRMTGNTGAGDVTDITEKFDLNKKKDGSHQTDEEQLCFKCHYSGVFVSCFVYFQLNTGPFGLECVCAFLLFFYY